MQNPDRPNQHLADKVSEAQEMAARGEREAAAEYLLREKCPLPVIARVLVEGPARKIQSANTPAQAARQQAHQSTALSNAP